MEWWYIVSGIIFAFIGWFSTIGEKSQWIRILDIILYGPILIYASFHIQPQWLQVLLLFFGITTITYNLHNYITVATSSS